MVTLLHPDQVYREQTKLHTAIDNGKIPSFWEWAGITEGKFDASDETKCKKHSAWMEAVALPFIHGR